MLTTLLLGLIHLQSAHFLHQLSLGMLHQLQHLNKKVSIVHGVSLLQLLLSPRSVDAFHLVRLEQNGKP